ncbi:MAG: META domain-containing protein [Gemmatimonadaceae bacterium]
MRPGIVVAALIAVACAQPPAAEDEPAAFAGAGESLVGPYWRLVELEGQLSLQGGGTREPHLRFTEDRVNGATGCNSLGGSYEVTGARLRFGSLATTRMACVEEERMRQETGFTRALERVERFVIRGDRLTLFQGDVVLARFVRSSP